MHIQSILALTDFSVSAEHAIERAAMIAKQHGAALKLMYFSETENGHIEDPFARLGQRAYQLAVRHGLSVRAVARTTATLHHLAVKARAVDLLVLDQRNHVLSRPWRGSLHGHLIRRCRCPVLVVKGDSQAPYARVLVAVDFNSEWRALVRYARRFESGAVLQVRSVAADPDCGGEQGEKLRERIEQGVLKLTTSLARFGRYLKLVCGAGGAGHSGASRGADREELLIVGKSRQPAWLDILFGNLTERRLRQAPGDVLVVPASHVLQPVELRHATKPAVSGVAPGGTVPPVTLRARPSDRGLA